MPPQSRGLALLAITGLAITLTACSSAGSSQTTPVASTASSASSPAAGAGGAASSAAASSSAPVSSAVASRAPAAVPAGYKRVGGTAQGISLAVPSSWADVDLSKQSAAAAISKLKLSSLTATQLTQSMAQLQQSKAIVAADLAYAATSRDHFTRNINAYCSATDVTDTGAAAVPVLKSIMQSQFSTIATHVTEQDTTIGGVPGLQTSYELKSGTLGLLYGSQLEVLPKSGKACFVTLTSLSPVQGSAILAVAAKTTQFT